MCYPPSNPYWTMQTLMGDPVFYFICLIAPVAALLPRWVSGTVAFGSHVGSDSILLCCVPVPFKSQKLKGPTAAIADCVLYVLSRLFFKALQRSLFPTQLQLGRQLVRRSPRKLRAPKETFAQGHLPGEPRTEPSEQRSISASGSFSQDCSSQVFWHAQQSSCSPEASGEPSVVDMGMSLREDTPLEGLGSQTPGSSSPGEVIPEGCPGGSKMKPTSASRGAALSSIFSLPSLSSLNWISSLSLVSGLGSVLQFSRSGLQMDRRDGEFLPSPPQPDQDLQGLSGQTTDYF